MCRYYDRLCKLEQEVAVLCDAIKKDAKITKLEDEITELKLLRYVDGKICKLECPAEEAPLA